jgi:hypothetical protein
MIGEETLLDGRTRRHPVRAALGLVIIAMILFAAVYQIQPFPAPWNDIYINLSTVVPALLAAVLATLVWRSFKPDDGPRPVWLYFSLGIWLWALAEIVWMVNWLITGDVPIPSLADLLWLVAYAPFAMAFLLQFRLIFHTGRRKELIVLGAIVVAVIICALSGTVILLNSQINSDAQWVEVFLEMIYTFSDLAMMFAALRLAHEFGRGLWGRAWISLLAFAISDVLYSYTVFTGLYAQAADAGNFLSLAVDSIYALSYMLLALGCYNQLLLVRLGPMFTRQKEFDQS